MTVSLRALPRRGRQAALALLAAATAGCQSPDRRPAAAPSPEEIRLADLMAERLELARRVAWIKFQNNAAVADPRREAELLASLTVQGEALGLPAETVGEFFRAQILASRWVQEDLIASWRRGGELPVFPPEDLARDIRPRLDLISGEMLGELEEPRVRTDRAAAARQAEIAILRRGFPMAVARIASSPLR